MKDKKHSGQLLLQLKPSSAKHSIPSTWCVYCNTNLRKDRAVVIRHLRENHPTIVADETLISEVMDNSNHRRLPVEEKNFVGVPRIPTTTGTTKKKRKKDKNKTGKSVPRLRVISEKSTRVYSYGICANCKGGSSALWRYAKSNRGTVLICGTCKPTVQEYSYGKLDALEVSHLGGGWAPKKPRH